MSNAILAKSGGGKINGVNIDSSSTTNPVYKYPVFPNKEVKSGDFIEIVDTQSATSQKHEPALQDTVNWTESYTRLDKDTLIKVSCKRNYQTVDIPEDIQTYMPGIGSKHDQYSASYRVKYYDNDLVLQKELEKRIDTYVIDSYSGNYSMWTIKLAYSVHSLTRHDTDGDILIGREIIKTTANPPTSYDFTHAVTNESDQYYTSMNEQPVLAIPYREESYIDKLGYSCVAHVIRQNDNVVLAIENVFKKNASTMSGETDYWTDIAIRITESDIHISGEQPYAASTIGGVSPQIDLQPVMTSSFLATHNAIRYWSYKDQVSKLYFDLYQWNGEVYESIYRRCIIDLSERCMLHCEQAEIQNYVGVSNEFMQNNQKYIAIAYNNILYEYKYNSEKKYFEIVENSAELNIDILKLNEDGTICIEGGQPIKHLTGKDGTKTSTRISILDAYSTPSDKSKFIGQRILYETNTKSVVFNNQYLCTLTTDANAGVLNSFRINSDLSITAIGAGTKITSFAINTKVPLLKYPNGSYYLDQTVQFYANRIQMYKISDLQAIIACNEAIYDQTSLFILTCDRYGNLSLSPMKAQLPKSFIAPKQITELHNFHLDEGNIKIYEMVDESTGEVIQFAINLTKSTITFDIPTVTRYVRTTTTPATTYGLSLQSGKNKEIIKVALGKNKEA